MSLTRQDTLVMKGIAICAMLCHHLYTCPEYIGEGIEPYTGLLAWIGTLGKVCVAMFLFCSGYGLTAQYQPTQTVLDDGKFVLRRLIKFYANYWVIFIIFVPITYFVFGRTLTDAYGENVNIIRRFIYDIFAVQDPAYNITWWFNKLIIILYLFFPILYRIVRFQPLIAIAASMVIARLSAHIPYDNVDICTWQLPFLLGVFWHFNEQKLPSAQQWLIAHNWAFSLASITLLIIMVWIRMYDVIPHWSSVRVDGFLACAITLCLISVLRKSHHVMNTLSFIGKHSMNIYMTHTFFNAYWYPEWLHSSEYMRGGGNFVILMILCLSLSIILELIKKKLGIYKLVNMIIAKL